MSDQVNEITALKTTESDNNLKNNTPEIDKMVSDAASSFDDSISLSTTSKQLDAIIKSLQDIPEVNEERVIFFKTEIELDNYIIDNKKIAVKMLNKVELFNILGQTFLA